MKIWIRRLWPAVAVMSLIFIASGIPASDLPQFGFWDMIVKKGGHMTGYAMLSASYLYAINRSRSIRPLPFLASFCLTILYAVSDEWHQSFTPGRSPSLLDVLIDGTGGLIGLALWAWILTRIADRN
jgi:VanZ family protein